MVSCMLDYRDVFDYFKKERPMLFKAFENMLAQDFVRSRELSFDSLKDVLAHTVMVDDNWLHY